MPDAYEQLLDAAIQHLEHLKEKGVRYVSVKPESLAGLNQQTRQAPQRTVQPPARAVVAAPSRFAAPQPAVVIDSSTTKSADPAKIAAFEDLRARAMVCVKCPH